MTFYLKVTIIARLLLFFVYITGMHGQRHDMSSYIRKTDLSDLTKGLSDAEIESALSDLTLSDLDTLSKLIDTSNAADYDYDDEGGYRNNNPNQRQFYGSVEDQRTLGGGTQNEANDEEEDASYDEEPNEDTEHVAPYQPYQIPRSEVIALRGENLRLKRENSKDTPKTGIDEEYLKQLENSFPRDQEQNNQEDFDDKKEHVRVKRD